MQATFLQVEFDVKEFHLSEGVQLMLRRKLSRLERSVDHFPVADLRVLIQGSRSNDISVKLSLILPGRTLVARDHGDVVFPAFDRCLESLVRELDGYKNGLANETDVAKKEAGTRHDMQPSVEVDGQALDDAVRAADYAAFRKALQPFDEELRRSVGRWVQRYPEVDDAIGDGVEIADIVEETMLEAFEKYGDRPESVPVGAWLHHQIDSAVKSILRNPESVMENISLVRTAVDAPEGKHPE